MSNPHSFGKADRTTVSNSSSTVLQRLAWPDIARGFGIILVVVGHAIGGLLNARAFASTGMTATFETVFYYIYTFHMPLFFFLSGMFFVGRMKEQPADFWQKLTLNIAYPYFLWGAIQICTIGMLGNYVNAPVKFSFRTIPSILWEPPSQFWFLYVLFISQCLFRFLPRIITLGWILIALCILRGVVEFVQVPKVIDYSARLVPFFALGVVLGGTVLEAQQFLRHRAAIAAALVVCWLALSSIGVSLDRNYLGLSAVPAGVAGVAMVVILSGIPKLRAGAWLAYLGRHSMTIFLLHVLFVAGTRIAIKIVAGTVHPEVVFPLSIGAGIVGPLIVYHLAERYELHRLLALAPWAKSKRPRQSTSPPYSGAPS